MKVDVRSLGFTMTEAMRAQVMEGLGRALRRRRQAVRRVEVRLSDVNGPRGGVDKRCTLRVRMHGRSLIAVTRNDADLYAAIAQAVDVAALRYEAVLRRDHPRRRLGRMPAPQRPLR
mgnify:CR=1 FL=1